MQTQSTSILEKRSLADQPAFYLIYLIFYFVPWLIQAPTTQDMIAIAVAIALFVPIHLDGHRRSGLGSIPHIIIISLIGFVMSNFWGSYGVFHIYAMVQAAFLRPSRYAWIGLVIVSIAYCLFVVITQAGVWDIGIPLLIGAVVGIGCIGTADQIEETQTLKRMREHEQEMAALNERERIAHDLHDALGQTLTMVALKSEVANKVMQESPEQAQQEVSDIQAAAHKALEDMRKVVADMNQTSVESELKRAQRNLAAADIQFSIDGQLPSLERLQDQLLGLAIREAITNILRHSGAEHTTAKISSSASHLSISLSNDGQAQDITEGSGINSIRQRVEKLGGQVNINSEQGFELTMQVPLSKL